MFDEHVLYIIYWIFFSPNCTAEGRHAAVALHGRLLATESGQGAEHGADHADQRRVPQKRTWIQAAKTISFKITKIHPSAHLKKSSRPLAPLILKASSNPPTLRLPTTMMASNPPNISSPCSTSVHTTARSPPCSKKAKKLIKIRFL